MITESSREAQGLAKAHNTHKKPLEMALRVHLMLMFSAISIVIVVITLYFVQSATFTHSNKVLNQTGMSTFAVVTRKLDETAQLLTNAGKTISTDFSMKQLILGAPDDTASIKLAMDNFTRRFNVSYYAVFDKDLNVLGSNATIASFNHEQLNELSKPGITWTMHNDTLYLTKATAIKNTARSRQVDAWLILATPAKNLISPELSDLTVMDVSIVVSADDNNGISIHGSTYNQETLENIPTSEIRITSEMQSISLLNNEYLMIVQALGVSQHGGVSLLLSIARENAHLSYYSLLKDLSIALLLALAVVGVFAWRFSIGVSRPLQGLVDITQSIKKGTYNNRIPSSRTKELNALSNAVKDMAEGIAEREGAIEKLAYFDKLTDLPNRNQFLNELETLLHEGQANDEGNCLLLLVDVVRFKEINDTMGHDAGDKLLTRVAHTLENSVCHEQASLVARVGSNEFGILMHSLTPQSELLHAITQGFDKGFVVNEVSLNISVKIGVVNFNSELNSAIELLQFADIALQHAKSSHNTWVEFHDGINHFSMQRLQIMSDLNHVVSSNQLQLFYQPKLNIKNNTVDSVECLIRWVHPEFGFVPPDEFITLAEQTGTIRKITKWVIETALKQYVEWQKQDIDLCMAVNISTVDLVNPNFPNELMSLVTHYAVAPKNIKIEVTESAIMSDPDTALGALHSISKMGFLLSIDDFGTGYSSMAQLKQMPVNELKIDRAFVREVCCNHQDRVMVKSMVDLAHNMSLTTVAEGIEDADSLHYLKDIGCTNAQGYHIARPMPSAPCTDWLKSNYQSSSIGLKDHAH